MKLTKSIAATAAPAILLLASTVTQAQPPGPQVSGFVDGVKPGQFCTAFVMYGTLYGTPSSNVVQANGVVLAWGSHQQMSFDLPTATISCTIDGTAYTVPLAKDITFGTLSFQ